MMKSINTYYTISCRLNCLSLILCNKNDEAHHVCMHTDRDIGSTVKTFYNKVWIKEPSAFNTLLFKS